MHKSILSLGTLLLIIFSTPAAAETYTGSWNNTTFGTTGGLTIEFTETATTVSGVFDFDGPVFGAGDPPALPFNAPIDPQSKIAQFDLPGTDLGDILATIDTNADTISIVIINIPIELQPISQVNIFGEFDLVRGTFTGTYEITQTGNTQFAVGTASAQDFYQQANFFYGYFAGQGDPDTGLAFWFYFRAYGDQVYYRSLGNNAYAQFKFYEGLAYFYYTFYKNSAPNLAAYFLYLNFGYAYLDYLTLSGDAAAGNALYSTYLALALAAL